MKTALSCVVDGLPQFEWQAFIWTQSLLANVGSNAADLYLHCLPTVSAGFRKLLDSLGAHVVDIEPFGVSPYCNKIQQCFTQAFDAYDAILLCDCDLFFIKAPTVPRGASFSGKIVDLANPPLAILSSIYEARGVPISRIVSMDCASSDEEMTLHSNLNGGLYFIDTKLLSSIGERWRDNAFWLLSQIHLLREYATHLDQVSLAVTLDELQIDVLPLRHLANFPIHLPMERLRLYSPGTIEVIHYHSQMRPGADYIGRSNIDWVDASISAANTSIRSIIEESAQNALFRQWRSERFGGLGSTRNMPAVLRSLTGRLTGRY